MMCPLRSKLLIAVVAILTLAIAGFAPQERQQAASPGPHHQIHASPQTILPPNGSGIAVPPDLAANRALARQQLAVIDEAWSMLEILYRNHRIEPDGTIGSWGHRRLEALRRAGAGKVEIIAALEKYINDLGWFEEIAHNSINHHHSTYDEFEIRFLRLEAETWLNEARTR